MHACMRMGMRLLAVAVAPAPRTRTKHGGTLCLAAGAGPRQAGPGGAARFGLGGLVWVERCPLGRGDMIPNGTPATCMSSGLSTGLCRDRYMASTGAPALDIYPP